MNFNENNSVFLQGTVCSAPQFSHEFKGEKFYGLQQNGKRQK